MSDEERMSRRASLKRLGAAGAAMIFGGAAATPLAPGYGPDGTDQDKPPVSPVDLAVGRMVKGHS